MRGRFRRSWGILARRFLGERPHLLIAEQHAELAGRFAVALGLLMPGVAIAAWKNAPASTGEPRVHGGHFLDATYHTNAVNEMMRDVNSTRIHGVTCCTCNT